MKATIYQTTKGDWVVEKCDPENDGICHKAIFCGPDAEMHACDHMQLQFGGGDDVDKGAATAAEP